MGDQYYRSNRGGHMHGTEGSGGGGGYQQPSGGGFAAYQNQQQQHQYMDSDSHMGHNFQQRQAPLYARGSGYQRGSHSGGFNRGHSGYGGQSYNQHQQSMYDGQMGYPLQSQQPMNVPPPPGRFGGFNPQAPSFTPTRNTSHPNYRNEADMAPPSYAMAPMYADHSAYRDGSFYNNQQYFQSPQMQLVYSDYIDDETAAYEAMYGGGVQPPQYIPSQDLNTAIIRSPVSQRLQEVLVGLEQLISDPEDFESWRNAIIERLKTMNDEQRTLGVRMIMEMVISSASVAREDPSSGGHPNSTSSQQNGAPVLARLLELVNREIPTFLLKSIMPTLKQFHTDRAINSGAERIALLKFFSECYERLFSKGESRVELIGKAFVDQAMDLIKPQEICDERMRAVIWAVKLSGPGLDASPATRPLNDELLTNLAAIGKGHPKLSEGVKTEIGALIEQRENGWGMKLHTVSSSGQLSGACSSSSSSVPTGAIIGEDGRLLSLSEEERRFLEEQMLDMEDDVDDIYAEMDKFVNEEEVKREERANEKMLEKLKICEETKKEEENKEEVKEEKEEEGTNKA